MFFEFVKIYCQNLKVNVFFDFSNTLFQRGVYSLYINWDIPIRLLYGSELPG